MSGTFAVPAEPAQFGTAPGSHLPQPAAQYVVHQPVDGSHQPQPAAHAQYVVSHGPPVAGSAALPSMAQVQHAGQPPTVVVPYPGAAPHGAPMPHPGAPYPLPAMPAGPSSAIPDPDSIAKQKKNYERNLDNELEQKLQMTDAELKQRKDALRAQMDSQLAMYKTQLEQATKQQELALEQEYAQKKMQLQQMQMQQKALLEQQASSLAMEYQQRKISEDFARQQEAMHKEMASLQHRHSQEMDNHARMQEELQMQHQQQVQAQMAYGPQPGAPMVQQAAPPAMYAAGGSCVAPPAYAPYPQPTTRQVIQYVGGQPGRPSEAGAPVAATPLTAVAEPTTGATQAMHYQYSQAHAYGGPPTMYGPPPGQQPQARPGMSAFEMIDQNHDGYITREEWQHAVGPA